ncbi:MAG: GDCCVxC domain-containing (seleno)protein [Candidatus Thiodiazotropha sp. (ex. Lucinoma kazani)]
MSKIVTLSELSCPQCGHRSTEEMPTDRCVYFYECKNCGELLKPKPGDCCVFCSYGTTACPPVQQSGLCCGDQPCCT